MSAPPHVRAASAAFPAPAAPSSTGLDPRTASALAYLAGPFSAVLFLWLETANRDVRFHAWQSLLALGGLGLAVALGYTFAAAAMFVSAAAVIVLVVVATALWGLLVVAWAICLLKAMNGRRWKLPIAGRYAERFATSP